jgi:ATP-dependent DNA helicase RecQ
LATPAAQPNGDVLGAAVSDSLQDVAARVFGFDALRREQLEAMSAIVDGRDVIAVMPTGSGKSAIYQVPAVLLKRPVLVISPLIALQHDQIRQLRRSTDAPPAVAINSRQKATALDRAWAAIDSGEVRYIFLGPEQLIKEDVIARLAAVEPSLMVVDEAHCISAWGHDFRPSYVRVGDAIDRLGRPPVAALTATASAVVRREIADFLGLHQPLVIAGGFDRPNIGLDVRQYTDDSDKQNAVIEAVAGLDRPGLLYCATRKDTQFYAEQLDKKGISAVGYHAGMSAADRKDVHRRFQDDEVDVVAATSAFGMGIDKPNVRFVVHASVPDSVDSYYQQIGRAGRDGGQARAALFYRAEDLALGSFFATRSADEDRTRAVYRALSTDTPKRLKQLRTELDLQGRTVTATLNLLEQAGAVASGRSGFTATGMADEDAVQKAVEMAEISERVERTRVEMMRSYAESPDCRRQFLLAYFGDYLPTPCGNCDRCRDNGGLATHAEPAIAPGTPVEHREWGTGVVLHGDSDRITVLFDYYGYRMLSVDAIRDNHVLSVPSQL